MTDFATMKDVRNEQEDKIAVVFNSGGFPKDNYVDRNEIEKEFRRKIKEQKLLVISGQTKVGKSVLVQNKFQQNSTDKVCWINCSQHIDKNENQGYMVQQCGFLTA